MTQLQAAAHRPALRPIPTQPIPLVEVDVPAVPVLVANAPATRGSIEALLTFHIDGTRNLAELAELVGLTTREVLHVMAGMVSDGLVLMTAREPSAPSPSPRLIVTPPPHHAFVDFADVFEELGLEQNSPGAETPTRHRVAHSQTRLTMPTTETTTETGAKAEGTSAG